jgi:hypothetical protein
MTPLTGRCVAGAAAGLAIAVSLTGCKSGGADKAPGGAKPTGGGVHLTAAQEVLAKVSNRAGGITSFRGLLSVSAKASGTRTEMKGKLAYRLKPTPALRYDVSSTRVNGRKSESYSEILAGDKLYLQMPTLSVQTGKPWTGISVKKLGGMSLNATDQASQGDPSLNATMLTASKDVREVGRETVGGVSTTHYHGTFDLTEGLAKLSSEQRAQAQKAFARAGYHTMTFDMWVDGQQLPRKVTMVSPPGAKAYAKTTMTYTAFNVPVSVAAPPKSQVADGSGILRDGGPSLPG